MKVGKRWSSFYKSELKNSDLMDSIKTCSKYYKLPSKIKLSYYPPSSITLHGQLTFMPYHAHIYTEYGIFFMQIDILFALFL